MKPMRRRASTAGLCALLLSLAAPALAGKAPPIEGPAELHADGVRAREALRPLKKGLKGALQAALAESPIAAVDACKLAAPSITEGAARPDLRVGRTSNRLRNPDNAPPGWARALLDDYVAGAPDAGARAVRLPGGGVGYVEPIRISPPCLACHGETVSDGVRARLAELYPEDRATGFDVGDFRGLFWVEFPAEG